MDAAAIFEVQIGDLKLSKELKEKLIGSDREGLGIGLELDIIDRRSEPDRRSDAINFGAC